MAPGKQLLHQICHGTAAAYALALGRSTRYRSCLKAAGLAADSAWGSCNGLRQRCHNPCSHIKLHWPQLLGCAGAQGSGAVRANLKTLGQGISAQVAAVLQSGDRLTQRSRMVCTLACVSVCVAMASHDCHSAHGRMVIPVQTSAPRHCAPGHCAHHRHCIMGDMQFRGEETCAWVVILHVTAQLPWHGQLTLCLAF